MVEPGIFLACGTYAVDSITWSEDHHGAYWTGYLRDKATGAMLNRIGTYEKVGDDGKRISKVQQEADLRSWGILTEGGPNDVEKGEDGAGAGEAAGPAAAESGAAGAAEAG